MGVAAIRVIGGCFDSSSISAFFDVPHFKCIIEIYLPLEAESLFVERTRGYGKATGVVACLTTGVVIASLTTSILSVSSATSLSLDNTNN